jgi:prolyl-tRNA editing enzyme YbaK/EbsC (Cys-tRNA(Pro) deacylase)
MKGKVSTLALLLKVEPTAAQKEAQIPNKAEMVDVREESTVAELMDHVGIPIGQVQKTLVNGQDADYLTGCARETPQSQSAKSAACSHLAL